MKHTNRLENWEQINTSHEEKPKKALNYIDIKFFYGKSTVGTTESISTSY